MHAHGLNLQVGHLKLALAHGVYAHVQGPTERACRGAAQLAKMSEMCVESAVIKHAVQVCPVSFSCQSPFPFTWMHAPGLCQRGAFITPGMLPTGPESKLVFPAFQVLGKDHAFPATSESSVARQ